MENNIEKILKESKKFKTATEFAEAAGISKNAFYSIQRGGQEPKLNTAYKIVNALGFKTEEITKVFPNIYNQKNS